VLKRRYVYVLLFAVPALLVSVIAGALMLAASAGALWLFVFGDNPWPAVTNTLLGAVFVLGSGGLWLALLGVAYAAGKQQEMRPTLKPGHVVLAVAITILLAAVIVVRVMGLTMVGARSNSLVCADFCRGEGFGASGTPPENSGDRTCSCYDAQGREVRRVLLSEGTSGNP
jgi:hypothetical protein